MGAAPLQGGKFQGKSAGENVRSLFGRKKNFELEIKMEELVVLLGFAFKACSGLGNFHA